MKLGRYFDIRWTDLLWLSLCFVPDIIITSFVVSGLNTEVFMDDVELVVAPAPRKPRTVTFHSMESGGYKPYFTYIYRTPMAADTLWLDLDWHESESAWDSAKVKNIFTVPRGAKIDSISIEFNRL